MRRLLLDLALVLSACALAALVAAPRTVASPERTVAKVRVPNVVGFRLDRATRTLHAAGLRVNEECSGLFGCIIKSRWQVCEQDPRPGTRVGRYSVVVVYAERRGEC
jgi:beta-lactam-binding protein with PASTA domain